MPPKPSAIATKNIPLPHREGLGEGQPTHLSQQKTKRACPQTQPLKSIAQFTLCIILLTLFTHPTSADIYQWEWIDPLDHSQGRQQSATLAPDGAGQNPGPNAILNNLDLTMSWMPNENLQNANLKSSNLIGAELSEANLTSANLREVFFSKCVLKSSKSGECNPRICKIYRCNFYRIRYQFR